MTTIFVYDASGQLVAEYSTQTAETPRLSYLTTDHLGSPRVVTDENGGVVDRKDYTAFGEESISAERLSGLGYTAADELRKGYTGYEKDNESGLDFAQARYYNAGHGRYTSIDPLTASASVRNPQTFNRYSYVLNSPYKFTDPLGLLPLSMACGGSCPGSFMGVGGGGALSSTQNYDSGWVSGWQQISETLPHQESQHADGATSDHQPGHAVLAEQEVAPGPPTVDVRQDKTIVAAIKKIKDAAKPLKEGDSPIISGVQVVEGDTVYLEKGTFIDGYGNETTTTGIIKPIAYIPIDQRGNIIQGGQGTAIIETVLTISGEKPQTTDKPTPPPPDGVFYDIQFSESGRREIKQAVFVGQFDRSGQSVGLFITGPNSIILDVDAKKITVNLGDTVRRKK